MRHTKLALATMAMAVLAACGGTSPSPGNQTPKITYTAQVTFGDSLSDVGTYAVGTVKALGGGKFTINGDNTAINPALTGKNYTELLAAQLGVAAPCPAVTGLNGSAALGFSVPTVAHSGCYGYAEGGSRVTNPVGPGNVAAPSLGANNTILTGSALGALTIPMVTQVANHLAAVGGKFSGTEMGHRDGWRQRRARAAQRAGGQRRHGGQYRRRRRRCHRRQQRLRRQPGRPAGRRCHQPANGRASDRYGLGHRRRAGRQPGRHRRRRRHGRRPATGRFRRRLAGRLRSDGRQGHR